MVRLLSLVCAVRDPLPSALNKHPFHSGEHQLTTLVSPGQRNDGAGGLRGGVRSSRVSGRTHTL